MGIDKIRFACYPFQLLQIFIFLQLVIGGLTVRKMKRSNITKLFTHLKIKFALFNWTKHQTLFCTAPNTPSDYTFSVATTCTVSFRYHSLSS